MREKKNEGYSKDTSLWSLERMQNNILILIIFDERNMKRIKIKQL